MTCGIYLIENKITGQKYVGQSVDIENRWKEHIYGKSVDSSRIDRAIKKHGVYKFSLSVITELPDNENLLNMHEKYWIKFYNTFEDDLHYNLTSGGDTFKHSLETRQKISKNHGKYWKGKSRSKETKQKISEAHKGENHWNYGKHHSEETKHKMSESMNTTGFFKLSKCNCKTCKHGIQWRYHYYDEEGNKKNITSNDFYKIIKKILDKGLKLEIIDKDKAKLTCKEYGYDFNKLEVL